MPKQQKTANKKQKVHKNSTNTTAAKARRLQQPKYKSFRVSKRIRQSKTPINGSFKLFGRSVRILIGDWRLFGGIVSVYLLLTVILVKGFSVSSGIGELKILIEGLSEGSASDWLNGLELFSVLLSNSNSTSNDVAGAYQSILLIAISLVLIWALRHRMATNPTAVTVRDAFYKSSTPFVPFLLVLIVIALQLIPLMIANYLYTVVIGGGLAVTTIETALWLVLLGLLVILSLYMVTSSIFALYIVTLPNMKPLQALRSARDLVRHRRLMIMRKVLFLPISLLVIAAVIIVPLIIVSPDVAEWLFFVLSMLTLAIVHSYLYHLYRELL